VSGFFIWKSQSSSFGDIMTKRKPKPHNIDDRERAFTIDEFWAAMGIGRSAYYELRKQRRGPREMKIGTSVRISPEARKAWRAQMECK
jgi:predicted DNA-binding transcriptional regulator AlpA